MTHNLIARSRTTIVLVGGAVAAWAVTVERMSGMDAGPGTDLGGLGWYLGIWITMTAAMMLPSAARAARHARRARPVPTVLFTAAYLAVWTGYGLVAYALFRLVTAFDLGWLAWKGGGPYVAGGVIVAAGIYELTPFKRLSLHRCRSAPSGGNALQNGLAHGLDCVGCSGALMAVLFVLGVMSLFWMAVVAVAIFAEKILPHGPRLAPAFAVALVALGLLVAGAPASVPGLTEPGGSPSMRMGAP
jgi:predicted metal-binding membrane protein